MTIAPEFGVQSAEAPRPAPLPYHRLGHVTGRHRWWRPLVGTLVAVVAWLVAGVVLYGASEVFGFVTGMPELDDGGVDFSPLQGTVLDLAAIAVALPVVLLTVLWLGRRPAGTVSSVSGGLRWGWLARCLVVAVAPVLLLVVGSFLVSGEEQDTSSSAPSEWVGWRFYLFSLAVLAVMVPLQAAAEEYLFRGWLLQSVGAFFRSYWWALVPQAALFAAAHGWGTVWGFIDLLLFGMVAGWLAVRTGGLEAAVALHALNNLSFFALGATVTDGLASDETAADMPWQFFVIDVVSMAVYTALILLWARRRRPRRTAEPIVQARWPEPPLPWPGAPGVWPGAWHAVPGGQGAVPGGWGAASVGWPAPPAGWSGAPAGWSGAPGPWPVPPVPPAPGATAGPSVSAAGAPVPPGVSSPVSAAEAPVPPGVSSPVSAAEAPVPPGVSPLPAAEAGMPPGPAAGPPGSAAAPSDAEPHHAPDSSPGPAGESQ
ncbi:CPBP family glutamic-type intramembrane protease [Streptomyces sp. bgisy159]|uniref:CPBP family glutamic-type intramembrane protease n=1 Tax=Streptomyces sp. bgisy159 TaxID=3413795 RepID=UPI003F4A79A2